MSEASTVLGSKIHNRNEILNVCYVVFNICVPILREAILSLGF